MNTTETRSSNEVATIQRRLASQANNRAWRLSESRNRTAAEDEEMRECAYSARYLWNIVGDENNRAHASQLVAHVSALLASPAQAKFYIAQSEPYFLQDGRAPWERACAFAVKASVAAASKEVDEHRSAYAEAKRLIEELPDPEDRQILNETLAVVPLPDDA